MRLPRATFVLLLAPSLWAQSNAVPGLDIQPYNIGDVSGYGRRGAAFPNGEAGFGIGHSYCNAGTVNIPWVSSAGGVMIDTYPKIAYLLARERDGRIEQVSGRSFAKHSRSPFNFSSGPCAPCQGGSGGFMFVGCSDTYGSGTNVNRLNLGPTTEIDPWLGTWNPIGSYFDQGDPAVGGAAGSDGVQSLTSAQTSTFDPVKNRVEVRESELVGGGNFFAQAQVVVIGEPVANRGNNQVSRPCTISWNGTAWSAAATGVALQGSVLNQWSGASVAIGGNGQDDGRFAVGVKVTGPIGGMWHYEYAVHNLDNARGGAAVRIPVDPAAIVQNPGFHDITADVLDDWTFTRTTNEISFAAAANNPLDWNTIYNVWFDCSVAPSFGQVQVDEARIGAGALSVAIDSEVPSGIPAARVQSIGGPCGSCAGSIYESFPTAAAFDLANSSMSLSFNGSNYVVGAGTAAFVQPTGASLGLTDDSSATVNLPFALPYPGGSTTTLTVCANGFISTTGANGAGVTPSTTALLTGSPRWAAAWHDLNPSSGGQVLLDASPAVVLVTWVAVPSFSGGGSHTFQFQFAPNGDVNLVWQSIVPSGNPYLVGWSPGGGQPDPGSVDLSATLGTPRTLCAGDYRGMTLAASARPVLGSTFALTTSNIPAGTAWAALVMSTTQLVPPQDLTAAGMTGCVVHLAPEWSYTYAAPPATIATNLTVPNVSSFIGTNVIAQTVSFSPPLTPLGLILSNGQILTLGL